MSETDQPTTRPTGQAEVSATERRRVLYAMMAQVFLIMLGIGLVGPIMPLYAESFGVGAVLVGGLIAIFGVARIMMNVPASHLAERFGRRPLLIVGPLLTALAAVATGLAGRFEQLLVFRFFQGLGSAAQTTAAMIVLADITTSEDRGRVMSWYQSSLLLGSSFGPVVGGLVGERYGFRAPFFVYAALATSAAVWALLSVPETRQFAMAMQAKAKAAQDTVGSAKGAAPSGKGAVWTVLADPNFILVSMVTLTVFFTRTGSRNTVLPLYGNGQLGLSPGQLGFTLTLIAVVNLFATNLCGYLCDRFGRKAAIVPGCLLSGLALWSFSMSQNYAFFLFSAVLLGVGTGIAGPAPAAYVADLAQPGRHGLVMGLYRTIGDVGVSIGPILLGWLSDRFGFVAALRTNALFFAIVGLIFAFFARETLRRATKTGVTGPARDSSAH